jgi:hypothetical protein
MSARTCRSTRAAICGVLLLSLPALADEDAPAVVPPAVDVASAVDVARLEAFLHAAARDARDARHANLAAGLIAGVALLPTGIVLARRSDDLSQATGIGMEFGGGIPLALTPLSLLPSPMEQLEAGFAARRAGGMSDAELKRVTLIEWRELALRSESRRFKAGVVETALGLAAVGIGLGFLGVHQVGDLSRTAQTTIGGVLVGSGLPTLQLGVRLFFQRSPQETWWDALSH